MLCTTSYFFKNTQYVIDTFIILPNGTNIITIVMFDPSQNVLPILLCALINVVVVWMTVNELFMRISHVSPNCEITSL